MFLLRRSSDATVVEFWMTKEMECTIREHFANCKLSFVKKCVHFVHVKIPCVYVSDICNLRTFRFIMYNIKA